MNWMPTIHNQWTMQFAVIVCMSLVTIGCSPANGFNSGISPIDVDGHCGTGYYFDDWFVLVVTDVPSNMREKFKANAWSRDDLHGLELAFPNVAGDSELHSRFSARKFATSIAWDGKEYDLQKGSIFLLYREGDHAVLVQTSITAKGEGSRTELTEIIDQVLKQPAYQAHIKSKND